MSKSQRATGQILPSKVGQTGLAARVRAQHRHRWLVGGLLVAPSVAYLLAVFLLPTIAFMSRSVDNRDVASALSHTHQAVAELQKNALQEETVLAALARDLESLSRADAALLARQLNYQWPGFRSLVIRTAHALREGRIEPTASGLVEFDARWNDRAVQKILMSESSAVTSYFLLSALDYERGRNGEMQSVPEARAIYIEVFERTFWISAWVTLLCVLLGFPVAYTLSEAPPKWNGLLVMLVLVPFWISVLVRTAAWVILLQREGLVNQTLSWLALIDDPLKLIFNRLGVYIAMTHVMLPFFIIPLYSVMRRIPKNYMRAAAGLGAPPVIAFLRVYFPQALPGVAAGALLVFVTSLGYYVTPILVGGPADQMVSYFVAYFTNESVNWAMASALGSFLLIAVIAIYVCLGRLLTSGRTAEI